MREVVEESKLLSRQQFQVLVRSCAEIFSFEEKIGFYILPHGI